MNETRVCSPVRNAVIRAITACFCFVIVGGPFAEVGAVESGVSAGEIDALFADYDRADSPGCAVAVVRGGEVAYANGYGMADLERGVAIEPDTVFYIGSNAKQFTAFCVHLLAEEGRLSLDDDVREHVPELPDYGNTIRLRHLLHHTSGLRGYFALLPLAGWRLDDVITQEHVLGLARRQKTVNFAPGERFEYCNTGYVLLAEAVESASGEPFAEFVRNRVFAPLGMFDSQVRTDYTTPVERRAESYVFSDREGFRLSPLQYEVYGPGGLYTTVLDMAKWDANYSSPRVGGPEVLARMQEAGETATGEKLDYASGLRLGKYRGLATVGHDGELAGYRTQYLRFPKRGFSVILFANLADFPEDMAKRVADICLEGTFPEPKERESSAPSEPEEEPVERQAIALGADVLDAYAGEYVFDDGRRTTVTRGGDGLEVQFGRGRFKMQLVAESETVFFSKRRPTSRMSFVFQKDSGGDVAGLSMQFNSDRRPDRFGRRVGPKSEKTREALARAAGLFYSEELDALYHLEVDEEGGLRVRVPRAEPRALRWAGGDRFATARQRRSSEEEAGVFEIELRRGAEDKVLGFRLSTREVRGIDFVRMRAVD